jgi:hypothetical protein
VGKLQQTKSHTENISVIQNNINELLACSEFDEDLGILSIDLDGNDFFILEGKAVFYGRLTFVGVNFFSTMVFES